MARTSGFRFFNGLLSLLTAAAIAVVIGLGVYMLNACKLRAIEGERVFYLHSQTSQGLRKTELELRDYAHITGESVCFARVEESAETLAQGIAEKYSAEILFTEEAAGVVSYYCYTTKWQDGIALCGQTVNLHVAVGETACAVGTPIIFGGF